MNFGWLCAAGMEGMDGNKENEARYFEKKHLTEDLKRRSVRSGAVTVTTQGVKVLLGMCSMVVLARLLTPADFGMVAMVTSITGFAGVFQGMGLSTATIQKREISHAQISTLFWISTGIGCSITIVLIASSPAIAWFYSEPRLVSISIALACVFVFDGLTNQHEALLKRRLRFFAISLVEITSLVIGIASAIIAALLGAGYWALVMMPLVNAASRACGIQIALPWRPGLPKRGSGIRKMLAFGGNLTASRLFKYFSGNIDNILIGRTSGAGALGFYTRAYRLLMLQIRNINVPIGSVGIPTLSALYSDPDRYRRYYRKGIEVLSFIGMPLTVVLFVLAEDVVLVMLGDQWMQAVPLFRALGPAAFVGTTNVATHWVFVTSNQTGRQLRLGFAESLFGCLCIVVGLLWGTLGVALAVSFSMVTMKVPRLIYCYYGTAICLKDFFTAIWRPVCSSIIAGILSYCAEIFVWGQAASLPARLIGISILYVFIYIGVFFLLPGGYSRLADIFKTTRSLMPTRTHSSEGDK